MSAERSLCARRRLSQPPLVDGSRLARRPDVELEPEDFAELAEPRYRREPPPPDPATAPASLGRALGQSVLRGRLSNGGNGAHGVESSPLPVEQIEHDG